jgi:hypothetical protein
MEVGKMYRPIYNSSTVNQPATLSKGSLRGRAGAATLLVLLIIASAFGIPLAAGVSKPATTANVAIGSRRPVKTRTAYVRDSHMRIIGTLRCGETFEIFRSAQSGHFYGRAFGQVNKEGYVKGEHLLGPGERLKCD